MLAALSAGSLHTTPLLKRIKILYSRNASFTDFGKNYDSSSSPIIMKETNENVYVVCDIISYRRECANEPIAPVGSRVFLETR